jgi:multidrug transporter EmrE-like cation transporter
MYAFFSGGGLIVLKSALTGREMSLSGILNLLSDFRFISGFILYAAGFALWMVILSKFKLNFAFPIAMSLFFIVSSLGSYFLLNEDFNIKLLVGIVLCLIGIIIINIS